MRQRGVLDERLVRGVEEDDRAAVVGVIDPPLQLIASENRAGRIVRRADIDEVRAEAFVRLGQEAVL